MTGNAIEGHPRNAEARRERTVRFAAARRVQTRIYRAKFGVAILALVSIVVAWLRGDPWALVHEQVWVKPPSQFSLTTERPLTVCENGAVIDMSTGSVLYHLTSSSEDDAKWNSNAIISPDCKYLLNLVAPPPGTSPNLSRTQFQIWDAATGKRLHVLAHKIDPTVERVRRVGPDARFSPDSSRLITDAASSRLWDPTTGQLLHATNGSMVFSSDSTHVFEDPFEAPSIILDAVTGLARPHPFTLPEHLIDLRQTPTGWLATTSSEILDGDSGRPIALLPNDNGCLSLTGFLPGRAGIFRWTARELRYYGGGFRQSPLATEIWDAQDLVLSTRLMGCGRGLPAPDGRRFFGVSGMRGAGIWDSATGNKLHAFPTEWAEAALPAGDNGVLIYVRRSVEGRKGFWYPQRAAQYWRRRYPEWWWGHFYRPEVWIAVLLSAGLLVLHVRTDKPRPWRKRPAKKAPKTSDGPSMPDAGNSE